MIISKIATIVNILQSKGIFTKLNITPNKGNRANPIPILITNCSNQSSSHLRKKSKIKLKPITIKKKIIMLNII
jgi:hypothetical protein